MGFSNTDNTPAQEGFSRVLLGVDYMGMLHTPIPRGTGAEAGAAGRA